MKKIKVILGVAVVALIGMFYACQKEESLVYKDNHSSLQKKQKWNLDEDSFLALGEANAPFQYAVYQEDEDNLSQYMQLILDSEEKGYIILSTNIADKLIYYGFITESSSYYNLNIFIDNPDDAGADRCFTIIRNGFDTFKEGWGYLMEKVKAGYQVSIAIDKKTGKYIVSYDDGN
jgi:hypothetical protein